MSIEYAIKLPSSTSLITSVNASEPDIDWIISASTSSTHNSSLNIKSSTSSARSTKSLNEYEQNIMPQSILKRKPSAKRLPWDEPFNGNNTNNSQNNGNNNNVMLLQNGNNLTSTTVPKVMRSREVAPLKAFPFEENLDINSKLQAMFFYVS